VTRRKSRYAVGQHPNSRKAIEGRVAPPAPFGNQRAAKSHAHSKPDKFIKEIEEARRLLIEGLSDRAPIKGSDGRPHPADEPTIEQAAIAVGRVRAIDNYLALNGYLDEDGNPRPALEALDKAQRRATDLLDRLGMNPRSRAALGVDLVRAADLATAMSEPDPERRRGLLTEAGLPPEEAEDE